MILSFAILCQMTSNKKTVKEPSLNTSVHHSLASLSKTNQSRFMRRLVFIVDVTGLRLPIAAERNPQNTTKERSGTDRAKNTAT